MNSTVKGGESPLHTYAESMDEEERIWKTVMEMNRGRDRLDAAGSRKIEGRG
jgi:hypothetical protein